MAAHMLIKLPLRMHFAAPYTGNTTDTQHLWNKKVTDEVAKIVNDEWKMKRHIIKQQFWKEAITKDTPHFNGLKGKIVIKNRAVLLDIINKYVARGSPTKR
jgi:hypothetical protein